MAFITTTMEWSVLFFSLSLLFGFTIADFALHECPTGWEDYVDHCYRYVPDSVTVNEAKAMCKQLGDKTFLLSVNSDLEHTFIYNTLNNKHDTGQRKRNWWTSGRRVSEQDVMTFYWEGDGKPIESYFYWHNDSIPKQTDKSNILYNYNGYQWGWILGDLVEKNPFICKISKEDIYRITEEDRKPDYGVDTADPSLVPRGPTFTQQPKNVVFDPEVFGNIQVKQVALECIADSRPSPTYTWYKVRTSVHVKIDPEVDGRYTLINGRLVIDNPSPNSGDDGSYYCRAENEYGAIISDQAKLEFGYISDFPKDKRSDVTVTAYQWGSVECSPPPYYPGMFELGKGAALKLITSSDAFQKQAMVFSSPESAATDIVAAEVAFSWYKDVNDWVRPQVKPYIFISNDGRLYFSEVTTDDQGEYYCMVNRPGHTASSGAKSMPTRLRIVEGSPGIYEPEIQSGFPKVFPPNPLVGQTIRVECFASGSAGSKGGSGSRSNSLQYYWERIEKLANGNIRKMPLPSNAYTDDHNRVLYIRNVGLYDGGVYRCSVSRPYGLTSVKDINIVLQATPYFSTPLKEQFLDEGITLRWRCEAGGEPSPTYFWLKNGQRLENATITDPEHVKVTQNVLTITNTTASRDNGMYQCGSSNILATRYSTAELRVLSFAPKFTKMPLQANQFATLRGNTTIPCKPEAAPTPTIQWYKDGRALTPGTETSRVRILPNGNLFISSIERSDEGVYKCVATNRLGTAQSQGNLTILESVTITLPPLTPTNIKVNKTSFLHCVSSYNPQLDVTYVWYHGDLLIEFEKVYRLGENRFQVWRDPHYKRGSGHYNGGIYIMNAQYGQTGRYTCMVESTNGDRVSRWADVRIVGPPSEPAGVYVDSTTVTTTSVVIQYLAAGNNGMTITSFVVETYNKWEGFWRVHETNVWEQPTIKGTMRHNITGLRPYSQYFVRMRAENSYGSSVPSLQSEGFWTDSILPDMYPEQVGGGGGKVGDLVITWKPLEPWKHNGKGLGYRVFYKNSGDANFGERKLEVSASTSRVVILVGERNFYIPYDVAVQAFNEKGDGPMSPIVVIRSAMKLPSVIAKNVRAAPMNSTACMVTWEEVDADRDQLGGVLGGYKMAYWKTIYGPLLENAPRVTLNGKVSEGTVIGLDPDTRYNFAVYVWNEAGNGPLSDRFIQRTLRPAPMQQPTEVKVYRLSSTAIHVTWRGVSTTNREEPLTGYKLSVWADGNDIKNSTDYDAKKENEMNIYGLHPEIRYKLRAFGYSRGGQGTMSSPAVEFTLGAASSTTFSLLLICLTAGIAVLRNVL